MEEIKDQDLEKEFSDELIFVNRIVKVTKGGRKFRFAALVSVGNANGKVGIGYGKAKEVPDAIRKANNDANKNLKDIFLKIKTDPSKVATIPHDVVGIYESTKVLLKPAFPGTGIIAGGVVRAVVSKAGVTDVLSKTYGRKNPLNVAKATMDALQKLNNPINIAKKRGKKLSEVFQ